jgi:hypothetical protein
MLMSIPSKAELYTTLQSLQTFQDLPQKSEPLSVAPVLCISNLRSRCSRPSGCDKPFTDTNSVHKTSTFTTSSYSTFLNNQITKNHVRHIGHRVQAPRSVFASMFLIQICPKVTLHGKYFWHYITQSTPCTLLYLQADVILRINIMKVDVLCIGDTVVDAFIKLQNAEVHCAIDSSKCTITMPFGAKIPYESAHCALWCGQ